jgi:Right handed beta helix region
MSGTEVPDLPASPLASNHEMRLLRIIASIVVMSDFGLGFVAPAAGQTRSVAEFLPADYARDGSVSFQAEIQRAIDEAAKGGATLVFPAMVYAVDENGWQLHSGSRLDMEGATFRVAPEARQDGAVFTGSGVSGVRLSGGQIVGRNDVWPDGVNIRGIHITGRSSNVAIERVRMRDLSSNGIGIFGEQGEPIRDVRVRDAVIEHCCNRYPDYLSGDQWEQGSQREDQGLIAFYFVEDFRVVGCRLERSRSDGTHFYRCRHGQITDNRIDRAKMGGYFVESCDEVIGRGNIMLENGSRGTTIERGSRNCIFADNVVATSGREGLWAPDCVGLVVSGNVFDRNGRKPNGKERHQIWNANVTINDSKGDPSNSPTRDYLVTGNLIYTTAEQIAAIRVDAIETTRAIVLEGNVLRGENRKIAVEGPNVDEVKSMNNVE